MLLQASQDPPPGMMGGVVSLVHDLVLLRGDGNYTCTANSSLGNSSRHRTVRVRSESHVMSCDLKF